MNKLIIIMFMLTISTFALELSKQPTVIQIPAKLKELKKDGYSKLFINLDKTGRIGIYGFYKSSPSELEKDMKKYIRKFKFSPAEYKNKKIPIRIHLKYNFKSQKSEIYKIKENKAFKKAKKEIDSHTSTIINDQKKKVIDKKVVKKELAVKKVTKKKEVKKDMKTIISEAKKEVKKDLSNKEVKKDLSNKKSENKKKDDIKKQEIKNKIEGSSKFNSKIPNSGREDIRRIIEKKKAEIAKEKAETRHALSQQKKEIPTLSKLPKLKKFIEAEYPEELRKNRIEGVVTLFIDINEKGLINNLGIIKSTNKLFNSPAIEAVKKFEFEPAEYKNKPVPVRITYGYKFVIKDEKDATKDEVKKAKDKKTIIVEKKDYDSLKGVVLSKGKREPVSYATVRVISEDDKKFEVITDDNGKFLFKNLEDGEYQIVVDPKDHNLGYSTTENIEKGKLVKMNIYLPNDLLNPYELTVVSKKGKKEVTKEVIKVSELVKIPGTNGDALKVVQNLPGVSRVSGVSGAVVVRGNKGMDSRIFIDGHYVPLLYHFGGLTSVFNSELLQDVSFYPGNYSTKYGLATGGVIDVTTRDVKTKKEAKNVHGYFDVDLIDTSAMIEVPIDEKSGIAIAVRRSYVDKVLPYFLSGEAAETARVLPIYYDWQLKYNYKFSKKSEFSFLHFGSSDKFELLLKDPNGDANIVGEFSMSTFFIVNIATWRYKFSKKLKLESSLALQYDKTIFKIGTLLDIKATPYIATWRENLEYKISKDATLNFGIDTFYTWAAFSILAPDAQPNKSDGAGLPIGTYGSSFREETSQYFLPAVYTNLLWDLGSLRVIPGLRLNYASHNNELNLDPRLNLIYTFNDKFLLKAGAGKYQQPPNDFNVDDIWGNPDITSQYSLQYSLGTEYRFTDYINASVEVFYNDFKDLIVTSREKVVIDGEVTNENYNNDGVGKAYGVEIFLRHNLSKRFFGWISYTIMKSERKDHPWEEWQLFRYDQTHILTVLGSYKLPWGFEIGSRVRYVTGSPSTPITNVVYDADNNRYIPLYGKINSARSRDFFQLDLRIDKTWQFQYWTLNTYIDIQNITNYVNQEGTMYNYDYSENREIEGFPIFPSFGIKGEF